MDIVKNDGTCFSSLSINSLMGIKLQIKGEALNMAASQSQSKGASWTDELGGQPDICPLKVENLDQPDQMLIEVLYHIRVKFSAVYWRTY